MPEPDPRTKQQTEGVYSINIVTVVSKFADEHLSLVRNISTVLAVAGVLIIARSIRLLTKFGSPSDIPPRFIEKNISIRGKVRGVTDRGLKVEHIPIKVPVISRLLSKRQPVSPLDVRLAGVDLTPQGRDWLSGWLRPDETVWLRLISRQDESLHCMVSVSRRVLFNSCLNEKLLRLGLGKTAPLHGLDPRSRLYLRLHKRLLKSQLRAEKKGEGLWERERLLERLKRALSENVVISAIKSVFTWMSRAKDR